MINNSFAFAKQRRALLEFFYPLRTSQQQPGSLNFLGIISSYFRIAYLYSMTNPGVYQLFVYGSLRSGFKSPAYEYISRFFNFVGEATVRGRLFDMGIYPAGITTTENTYIKGELYAIKTSDEFSWAIGQLDDYEGVAVEPDEVQLYKRALTDVSVNNTLTQAWIYWYNGEVSGRPLIESGDLMQYLEEKK